MASPLSAPAVDASRSTAIDDVRPGLGGVLLVGTLPAGPLVGGVEVGVEMLLSSELRARHGLHLFNTARLRDPSRPLRERLSYQVGRFVDLVAEIRRTDPRLVHVKASAGINYWQGVCYSAIARLCGRPVLLQLHGGDFDLWYRERGRLKRRVVRASLRVPSRLVVLSEYWRSFVQALCPDRPIDVVPNGVRTELVRPRARAHDGEFRVVTVGALGTRKGHFDILDAAARIDDPSVRFVFAGGDEYGGEEAALRARARELGVQDRVGFAGMVTGDAKWQLLADSDLFLLPSYAENMPNALLEAMAAGLPAVCTPTGAVGEMAGDGIRFVPAGTPDAIATAIVELKAAPQQRAAMGRANRARVDQRFAFGHVSALIEAVYRQVAGEQRR